MGAKLGNNNAAGPHEMNSIQRGTAAGTRIRGVAAVSDGAIDGLRFGIKHKNWYYGLSHTNNRIMANMPKYAMVGGIAGGVVGGIVGGTKLATSHIKKRK